MLDIDEMAEILEDFARQFTVGEVNRDFFSDFLIYNDIGLPLAQCVVYNLATPTEQGRAMILETWNQMCELLQIDPNQDYEDFDDCVITSGLDEIEDDED